MLSHKRTSRSSAILKQLEQQTRYPRIIFAAPDTLYSSYINPDDELAFSSDDDEIKAILASGPSPDASYASGHPRASQPDTALMIQEELITKTLQESTHNLLSILSKAGLALSLEDFIHSPIEKYTRSVLNFERYRGLREVIFDPALMPTPTDEHKNQLYVFLDLDETLLHSKLTSETHTVDSFIRPMAKKLIEILAHLPDVTPVLWSAGAENYVLAALDMIDPNHYIKHIICRQITQPIVNWSPTGHSFHAHSKNIKWLPAYYHGNSILIDNSLGAIRDCTSTSFKVLDFVPTAEDDPRFDTDKTLLLCLYIIINILKSLKTKSSNNVENALYELSTINQIRLLVEQQHTVVLDGGSYFNLHLNYEHYLFFCEKIINILSDCIHKFQTTTSLSSKSITPASSIELLPAEVDTTSPDTDTATSPESLSGEPDSLLQTTDDKDSDIKTTLPDEKLTIETTELCSSQLEQGATAGSSPQKQLKATDSKIDTPTTPAPILIPEQATEIAQPTEIDSTPSSSDEQTGLLQAQSTTTTAYDSFKLNTSPIPKDSEPPSKPPLTFIAPGSTSGKQTESACVLVRLARKAFKKNG